MALDIPLPTELPDVDPSQYTPLLLSAIGEFLQAKDVWADTDYDTAYAYMEELKYYVVFLMQGGAMPVGGVQWSASASIPTGWLRCDGSAVLRSQYAKLFAEIGVAWGAGNGTTTFNLPDLRGRSPMGVGTSPSLSLGGLLGEQTHVLTASENGVHTHLLTDNGHAHLQQVGGVPAYLGTGGTGRTAYGAVTTNSNTRVTTDVAGTGIVVQNSAGGSAHNNIHPVAGMYPIIFAGLP